MKKEHNVELSAAELANLWGQYQNDTLSVCTIKHFLANIEDKEIKKILEYALELSNKHIQFLHKLFSDEKMVIPQGFTDDDVVAQAPRLFTDGFYLIYIQNMGKIGMDIYSLALANSARLDVSKYFTECLYSSAELYNRASSVMLDKGIMMRAPQIPKSKKVEFVQKQSFLTGWFNRRRPINALEISHIYFNLLRNILGEALLTGYSQVAKLEEVRKYLIRGRDIASKHVEIFNSVMSEELLPSPSTWITPPTDSTVAPFSDKLMLYQVTSLNGIGIGHYGASLGASMRRDLASHYTRILTEIAQYSEDGINIMIDQGWLEKPPHSVDRNHLAKD
ncbi:DUF3231 family protein [Virgibacillus byunsanensis]|uniref:DUF3231 family protein n=1 Tax=Virgibacillus byunsanensis TaxID=570945 RepID=A0ABW3LU95_9BACI